MSELTIVFDSNLSSPFPVCWFIISNTKALKSQCLKPEVCVFSPLKIEYIFLLRSVFVSIVLLIIFAVNKYSLSTNTIIVIKKSINYKSRHKLATYK